MTDKVPEWVHMAEVPPPVDEEPWSPQRDTEAPRGGAVVWALIAIGVSVLVGFVVWRLTRG